MSTICQLLAADSGRMPDNTVFTKEASAVDDQCLAMIRVTQVAAKAHRGNVELVDASVNESVSKSQETPSARVAENFERHKRDVGRNPGDAEAIDRRSDRAQTPAPVAVLVVP